MRLLEPERRIHVVGVGGAGMSGLALWLAERGAHVRGSDERPSDALEDLAARRIETFLGHDPAQVGDAQSVLWSPAVGPDNPELAAARARGLELVPRAAALAEIARTVPAIGVAGTHGKTTASSMLVQVLLAAGRDVGWLIGAPVLGVGAHGHFGATDVVLEVDESYGTMAEVAPNALALTNVEADHLDHYGTLAALEEAFAGLVERTRGPVVAWVDDPGAARALSRAADATAVGTTEGLAGWLSDAQVGRDGARAALEFEGERLALDLRVTGRHNLANAALVAVLARRLGVESRAIEHGLANFLGAPRRFQRRGRWRDLDVIEDYAHLPGEIAATIQAAREVGYERVGVVYQPHRVTRTVALADQFAPAFAGAHVVIVTDLYSAGEPNPDGVTGEVVARALAVERPVVDTRYVARLEDVPGELEAVAPRLDLILILGAGDVGAIVADLPGGLT